MYYKYILLQFHHLSDVTPAFDIVTLSDAEETKTPIPVPGTKVNVSFARSAVAVFTIRHGPNELYVMAPFTVLNVVTPSLFTVTFPEPDVVIPVPAVMAVTPVLFIVTFLCQQKLIFGSSSRLSYSGVDMVTLSPEYLQQLLYQIWNKQYGVICLICSCNIVTIRY